MTNQEHIDALKETIQWFKKQIEPHDCGWMHTTIAGLNHRIKFLKKEIKKDRPKETWIEGYNKHKKDSTNGKERDALTTKRIICQVNPASLLGCPVMIR